MHRLAILSFLCFSLHAGAQNATRPDSAATRAGKAAPQGGNPMTQRQGKMYGKIVDNSTGRAIDAASVTILHQRNPQDTTTKAVMAGNVLTEPNGEFLLENIPTGGKLTLVIDAMGYDSYREPVAFDLSVLQNSNDMATAMMQALNRDLGNIRLLPKNVNQLSEVTVKATTPQFSLQGEKKVFNVDQNLNSQGGTVTDVLRNVPGVLVDADGNASIRNSSPQILVDGRQTTLTLDQIPADAVESLEIITNPSARYDAQGGSGGVLNVVLKKNRRQGYNGNVRAGVDSRGGGNLGGDFNMRSGKFNVSLSANGRRNAMYTKTLTERLDQYTLPNSFTQQDGDWNSSGYHGFTKLGLDYFMTNRTTLSAGVSRMGGRFDSDEEIDITRSMPAGSANGWAGRTTESRRNFDMTGLSLGGKHLFPQPGRELTTDITYNQNTNSSNSSFRTDSFTTDSRANSFANIRQKTSGAGNSAFGGFQADYVHPFGKAGKMELGVKTTLRRMENDNNNYNWSAFSGDYVALPNPFALYKSTEQVYAAYVSYSGNFSEKTSYQAGLRGESSRYVGDLPAANQSFTNTYPVSLFPSVFLSHKLSDIEQVQASYRRGINRPSFWQLFPFADYSDPLNIRQGNASLKPEFTNSAELTYLKNWNRTNYGSASAYYRRSDGLITAYQRLAINPFTGQEAVVSTFTNLGSTDRYGLELIAQYAATKWWTLLANVNGYNAVISSDSALALKDNYLSGFGKLTNTFKLPYKLTVQLSGTYQSRTNLLPDEGGDGGGRRGGGGGGMFGGSSGTAQGYLDANWFADLSVRKTFGAKDAMNLTLSCNDLFGTRHFIQHTENSYFVQDYDRISNPYTFRLNFGWRFGQSDNDLLRRKNTRSSADGADMGGF